MFLEHSGSGFDEMLLVAEGRGEFFVRHSAIVVLRSGFVL